MFQSCEGTYYYPWEIYLKVGLLVKSGLGSVAYISFSSFGHGPLSLGIRDLMKVIEIISLIQVLLLQIHLWPHSLWW